MAEPQAKLHPAAVAEWMFLDEGVHLRIATWNLNNRVGKCRFRPEAADAAIALNADLLVFTEFFPQVHEDRFRSKLRDAGWCWQLMSPEPMVVANRILMASRLPLRPLDIELPAFDEQFPPNVLAATCLELRIVGVRIPAYKPSEPPLTQAWDWLEVMTTTLATLPAVVLGDLNVTVARRSRSGEVLRRILSNGWRRASPPEAPTYFGHGERRTEIDYILVTGRCRTRDHLYVVEASGFKLADATGALSDHAAVVCDIDSDTDAPTSSGGDGAMTRLDGQN